VVQGWVTRLSAPPKLGARANSRSRSATRVASAPVPATSRLTQGAQAAREQRGGFGGDGRAETSPLGDGSERLLLMWSRRFFDRHGEELSGLIELG
jgi:hypothetical protein